MSTGSSYANQSAASRPILAPGAATQFKTWSSINQELAPSLVPQAVKVLPGVARSVQQEDRALFREAVLNIVVPLGAALVAVGTGVSFGVSIAYWFF